MLDLVIRGGQVVTPQGVGAWDVGLEGERIVAVAVPGTLPREAGGSHQWKPRVASLVALLLWLAVCFAAPGLGSIPTTPAVGSGYRDLVKLSWTPPASLFAPA